MGHSATIIMLYIVYIVVIMNMNSNYDLPIYSSGVDGTTDVITMALLSPDPWAFKGEINLERWKYTWIGIRAFIKHTLGS
jgi:hypothetical protein